MEKKKSKKYKIRKCDLRIPVKHKIRVNGRLVWAEQTFDDWAHLYDFIKGTNLQKKPDMFVSH